MPLLSVSLDLSRTASALERIASALERLSPPISDALIDPQLVKRGPSSLVNYGNNNKLWLKENFQSIIQERGLSQDQSQEILSQALSEYNEEDEEELFMEPL